MKKRNILQISSAKTEGSMKHVTLYQACMQIQYHKHYKFFNQSILNIFVRERLEFTRSKSLCANGLTKQLIFQAH